MIVYTYSEARQKFSTVLDKARIEGNVQIIRKDGQKFLLSSIKKQSKSPLDVDTIQSNISTDELVSVVREYRER